MIILRGKLRWQDLVDAGSLHSQILPSKYMVKEIKIKELYALALVVLFVSLLALLIFLLSGSFTITLIILAPIFILLLLVLIGLLDILLAPRIARRQFSQNKGLQYEYEYIISPTMIESSYRSETIESGTIRYLLSDFYKYKANEDIIILYQSKNIYHIFPCRFFASEEDFKTFISYIEASLPTPKR